MRKYGSYSLPSKSAIQNLSISTSRYICLIKIEAFCTKNEDFDQIYLNTVLKTHNVEKPKIRTISAATLAGKSPKIPALFQTCFEFGRLHWALDYITVNFERKFKCLQFSQKTELENLNFCPRVG